MVNPINEKIHPHIVVNIAILIFSANTAGSGLPDSAISENVPIILTIVPSIPCNGPSRRYRPIIAIENENLVVLSSDIEGDALDVMLLINLAERLRSPI